MPSLRSEVSLDNQMQKAQTFERNVSHFSHPISKGQGLRDSQHLCFQSWLWACRNQTPPPSSRIRTVCTGRGTSLCITKSQRFYLPLAVCVTMAPFRCHGSGLGATVAHVFTPLWFCQIPAISGYSGYFDQFCC